MADNSVGADKDVNKRKAGRPRTKAKGDEVLKGDGKAITDARPTSPAVLRVGLQQGPFQRTRDYLTRLPQATDDLGAELGIDVLERMYNDPQISASCETLILQALSKGLRAKPRYSDRSHPLYKPALEVYDFISYALDFSEENMMEYLEVGMTETLEDICRSRLKFGNSVSEWTTRIQVGGPIDGKMTLAAIRPLHPSLYGFVVDDHDRVPGLAVYTGEGESAGGGMAGPYPGVNSPVPDVIQIASPGRWGSQMEVPADNLPAGWEVLPIGKFLVTSHRRKHGDPRGASVLRHAFNAWFLLMQVWPEFLKYLTQFASPSLKGILGEENSQPYRLPGTTDMVDPLQELYDGLLDFQNGSVVVGRYGTVIEALYSDGTGQAFIEAISLLNKQMIKGILHSLLATETANNQTRAASTTHKDILDLPVRGLKNGLCSMMHRQCFKRLVYWNYGPLAAQLLTPWATLGELAPEDRNETMKALSVAGFRLTPSQYIWAASELEIDPPTQEELQLLEDGLKNESNPPSPVAPGGQSGEKPGNGVSSTGAPTRRPTKKPSKTPTEKEAA